MSDVTIHCIYQNVNYIHPTPNVRPIAIVNHEAVVDEIVAHALVAAAPGTFWISSAEKPKPGDDVLVVRNMGLGDVLMATPIIRAYSKQGHKVDVMTEERYRCLFDRNPYVRRTIPMNELSQKERAERYGVTVDLCGFVEHAENSLIFRNRIKAFLDRGGFEEDHQLDYFVTEQELVWARGVLRSLQEPELPTVMYVMRDSTSNRSLAESRSRGMIDRLLSDGYNVLVIDHERLNFSPVSGKFKNLTAQTNIRQVGAIMALSDVVVTPDTGTFHLAQALKTPAVTFFGPFPVTERKSNDIYIDLVKHKPSLQTSLGKVAPNGPNYNCWLGNGQPCRKYSCIRRDPDGTVECIAITPDRLMEGVREAIKKFGVKGEAKWKTRK